ncbi:MAG: hypothetical protein FGM58_05910 [Acidimicrobiia bacterium]|nr:hypothetical protein [Acidimicrobiia bacterium]
MMEKSERDRGARRHERRRYRRAWGGLRRPLRRAIDRAPETMLMVHLPKTGGTSLADALSRSPDHAVLRLPLSTVSPFMCECGAPSDCTDHAKRAAIMSWRSSRRIARPLVVKFNHETYGAVDWVRRAAGDESLPVLMAVRPRRDRLRSVFTDYWTRVAVGTGRVAFEAPPNPHLLRTGRRYTIDAMNYGDLTSGIDGVPWWSAFGRYGPGVPFFMDEVFAGDVGRLERELESGRLRLVTTARLDQFLGEFLGSPAASRRRVSRTAHEPTVVAALADAAHLVDELAERDASFDRFIADHLGEPDFYVD